MTVDSSSDRQAKRKRKKKEGRTSARPEHFGLVLYSSSGARFAGASSSCKPLKNNRATPLMSWTFNHRFTRCVATEGGRPYRRPYAFPTTERKLRPRSEVAPNVSKTNGRKSRSAAAAAAPY